MTARRSFLLAAAALALAGCPNESGGSGGGGSGAGGSATGGSPTGGSATTTTTTTTTTTSSTMDVPLTCSQSVTVPAIEPGECDLLNQDCPIGETCRPTDDGTSTFCRKEGGLKGPGKPCNTGTGFNECWAGLYCVGPTEGYGVCTRPCCPTDDQPCNGGDCNAEVNFGGGLIVMMCSYTKKCTLFAEGECEDVQQCQLLYPEQSLAVCLYPAGKHVPEGEPCAYVNECGEANVCWNDVCRYSCLLEGGGAPGSGGCPDGQTCANVYAGSGSPYGVCQ